MSYKEDDLILCTVTSIEGTTVFVELEDKTKGSMVFSEVSAGRIRNMREFISLGKKIVCKVLRVQKDHLELSLRRVTVKEKEAVMDKYTKERMFKAMLKPIIGEKVESVIKSIAEEHDLAEFIDKLKENPQKIEPFVTAAQAGSITKILAEKRDKEREVKKNIMLKTQSETGLQDIQEVLKSDKATIHYLGSSIFSIEVKDKDIKTANTKLNTLVEEIKEKARLKHMLFDVKS